MINAGTKLGPYEILSPLGAGGMGEVYRAKDTTLGREVAIKVLPELFSRDPERVQRFQREAKVLASLNHPNIAAIYGFETVSDSEPSRAAGFSPRGASESEESPDFPSPRKLKHAAQGSGSRARADHGVHFLVMELVEGDTLSERLKLGPMSVEDALDVAKQMAEALEAAHERGVIHRDLKPANVIITPDGNVKVLDFGLAKAMGPVDERSATEIANSPTLTAEFTRAGTILGTAAYMSPEQARGKPLDKRTDIWSFGCVLYECLGGRRPFGGETATDLIAKILERDPDWDHLPANTPPVVTALIQRCFRKDRKERLRDIGEAWVVLNGALSGEMNGLALTGYGSKPVSSPLRRVLAWSLCGIMGIALGVTFSRFQSASRPQSLAPIQMNVEISPDHPLFMHVGAQFAFSPDGSLFVYVTESKQKRTLNLRRMNQLGSIALSGTDGAIHPFFSPDGEWIAFFTDSHLKKISVSGGTPITLCETDDNRGGTWSRDGTIVFAPSTSTGLFRINSSGGVAEEITRPEENTERSHRWPRFTPDGEHVLFTSETTETDFSGASTEVLFLDSGKRKLIHRGGSYPQLVAGEFLIFVRESTAYGARLGTDTWELQSSPIPIIEGIQYQPRNGGAQIAVADSGIMAYHSGSLSLDNQSLVFVDRKGTCSPLLPEKRAYFTPAISPDGQRLVVSIIRSGAKMSDLWLYDMTRQTLGRLTFSDSVQCDPIWSPNGERIVFSSSRDGVVHNLYSKRADGTGEVRRLTSSDADQFPFSLASDGKTLVFGQLDPTTEEDLWTLSLEDEAKPEPFLVTSFEEWGAVISPNGKWLAYGSDESGRREIYIRPFPKAPGKWQVSTQGGERVLWSPDGKELFYWNEGAMIAVAIDTSAEVPVPGQPTKLFDLPGGHSYQAKRYDITPDGEHFIYVKDEEAFKHTDQAHLRFVFNWFSELEARIPKGKK